MTLHRLHIIFVCVLVCSLVGIVEFVHQPSVQAKEHSKNVIIVLKDSGVDPNTTALEMARTRGFSPNHIYKSVMKGFSATVPTKALAQLEKDPRVEKISEDPEVTAFAQITPTGVNRVDAELNTANKGTGIGVAVLDTGIDLAHPDLAPNIVANKNCLKPSKTAADDNGHGTHVAGTVAAINNANGAVGVAPEAKLIAVKVLSSSGSGTWSSVICGIDWVTANAQAYNIKVANMSLGGPGASDNNCGLTNKDALHMAICRSTAAGVTYVVAAGNDNKNASTFVPAAYDDAVITVSALADSDGKAGGTGTITRFGKDDVFASFSNYGSVVDIAAPGVGIYSTFRNKSYSIMNGTSMAAPHVAAAVALYLKANPSASWTQVRDALKAAGESLGNGHTDPTGLHPEPVLKANAL